MRIAWFTPFTTRSAIGRFSQYVTAELAKHAEVDLWVDTTSGLLPTSLRLLPYDPALPLHSWWPANHYDLAICNFGDCLSYHQSIFEFSRHVPFVAILHDFVMHHFFVAYYYEILKDLNAHLRRMEFFYGDKAKDANQLARQGSARWVWETDRVMEFPLFEDCLSGALGAVAHSRFFASRISSVFPGPVRHIPIAYPADSEGPVIPRQDLPFPQDRLLLVTVGNVNPNKRIEAVIETLIENPELASKLFYVVCGEIQPHVRARLQSLAGAGGVEHCIRLNGWTSDMELRSWLNAADICINLRNPAMEGGSASLAQLMLLGKPGIVSDTGVYAEMPGDCVLKVSAASDFQERQDLAAALSRLAANPQLRSRIGLAARQFASENFAASSYCASLLDFLNQILHVKPALEAVHHAGLILRQMAVDSGDPVASSAANMSFDMFCAAAAEAPWRATPNPPPRDPPEN